MSSYGKTRLLWGKRFTFLLFVLTMVSGVFPGGSRYGPSEQRPGKLGAPGPNGATYLIVFNGMAQRS